MNIQKGIQRLSMRFFNSTEGDQNMSGFFYYAFISYNEKDEKWAKWLQWKLEHYRIPIKARKEQNGIPKRIKPVFWYKNDLAGAHLSGSIKKELKASQYLIVICSRNSAKSEWVNDEVSYFKDELGRSNKIIPFVVDGMINALDPDLECLPLPIRNLPRSEEMRCIDVREYGKNKALVNIISTLLNIRFNVLWNRFRFERIRLYAVCVILSLILFCCWNYYFHTKYNYYVNLEDCYGLPTGIIKIDNKEAKDHFRLYRFEYRKQKLQRVIYVDGKGNPQDHENTEFADRPCRQELIYNNGTVSQIVCKNSNGRILYIMQLSKDRLSVDLKDEDEDQAANFIYSSTAADHGQSVFLQSQYLDRCMKSPSKIARYVYDRDDDGYIIRKMFARHNGDDDDISVDANGISGLKYERDSLHRVIKISFLDNHGDYRANNIGVASKRYKYDEYGNLAVVEYLDVTGNLKYNELHWARARDIYNDKGYYMEELYYGADGNPCVSVYGYHKSIFTYQGNIMNEYLYDIHDIPTYSLPYGEVPGGCSVISQIRDDRGRIIELQYKDFDGELIFNNQHYAISKYEYNDMSLPAGIRYYDIEGAACSNNQGIHYVRLTYNDKGCLTEQSTYNIHELPCNNMDGIHRVSLKYDNTDHRVSEIHTYNLSGLPIYSPLLNGAAWVRLGYHGSSNMVSDVYFYTVDDNLMETSNGARVSCERDSYGQITSFRYYNSDNELYSDSNHFAIIKFTYNSTGMVTDRCYYDINGSPMLFQGVFRVSISYTQYGRPETIRCYDTMQQLVTCNEGWAIQKYKYKNNVVCECSSYGETQEPTEVYGVHKYIYEIDECGNILSQSTFDKAGKPTVNSQFPAHKVVNIYDEKRRNIGRDYYNPSQNKPFVCIRNKLNRRGLTIEQTAFDSDNELVESPFAFGGAAKVQCEYDSLDRLVHLCAYNKSREKMTMSPSGYAEQYRSFDNHIQEVVFLDENNNLVNNNDNAYNFAYGIFYISDIDQPLFNKVLKLSYNGDIDTICEVTLYDIYKQPLQVIRFEDAVIKVYDLSSNKLETYYSFSERYDEYMHKIDSVENDMKVRYGGAKFTSILGLETHKMENVQQDSEENTEIL